MINIDPKNSPAPFRTAAKLSKHTEIGSLTNTVYSFKIHKSQVLHISNILIWLLVKRQNAIHFKRNMNEPF